MPVCRAESATIPTIVVSNYPTYVAAQHIVGTYAEIVCLDNFGDDEYTPDEQALETIEDCDLLVVFGTEEWLNDIPNYDKTISIMNELTLLDTNGNEWAEGSEIDDHFWMAPINMALAGYPIAYAMSSLDESHTAEYSANAETFSLEMIDLDSEIRAATIDYNGAEINGENGCSVAYFAKEYGLNYSDNAIAVMLDVIQSATDSDYATRMLENVKRLKQ